MCSRFEWNVATRYLRARREEGFISLTAFFSLSGIALGVMTLIVVLSVMNGVRGELIKSIIGLEGHITAYAPRGGLTQYKPLAARARAEAGVQSVVPKIEGQVMVSNRGAASGAMVLAFPLDQMAQKPLIFNSIVEGDAEAFSRGEGVLVGARLAEKLGLRVGDAITLISPEGQATVAGMVPRIKAYPVVGLLSIGMVAYDTSLVVMPFSEAQVFFRLPQSVSSLEITVSDAEQSKPIAQRLEKTLAGMRIYEWQTANNHIFEAVQVQRNVMFLILVLIIVVASFNIISSLIMLVREKQADIAILRTMGASRGSMLRIFVLCGASVGVLGTLVGLVLGLLVSFNTESIQRFLERQMGHKLLADELYFLSHLPARVDGSEVMVVVCVALALSLLATIYPARRAASLDPAEVLRHGA